VSFWNVHRSWAAREAQSWHGPRIEANGTGGGGGALVAAGALALMTTATICSLPVTHSTCLMTAEEMSERGGN
jgi:hypothetical protein